MLLHNLEYLNTESKRDFFHTDSNTESKNRNPYCSPNHTTCDQQFIITTHVGERKLEQVVELSNLLRHFFTRKNYKCNSNREKIAYRE